MEFVKKKSSLKVSSSRKEILVSSILPKDGLEIFNFCPSLYWGRRFFVCFLEELKNQKARSKITDL